MDKIIVTILGAFSIMFMYWFFLIKRTKEVSASESVDITVEGGYTPEIISVSKGKKTKLNFVRKDPNSCLEEVVLGDFGVRKYLPLNQKVSIEITPQKAGEFEYTCGMGMYHGTIKVKD